MTSPRCELVSGPCERTSMWRVTTAVDSHRPTPPIYDYSFYGHLGRFFFFLHYLCYTSKGWKEEEGNYSACGCALHVFFIFLFGDKEPES